MNSSRHLSGISHAHKHILTTCIISQYKIAMQNHEQFSRSLQFLYGFLNFIKITATLDDNAATSQFLPSVNDLFWPLSPAGWFRTPDGTCINLIGLLSNFFRVFSIFRVKTLF